MTRIEREADGAERDGVAESWAELEIEPAAPAGPVESALVRRLRAAGCVFAEEEAALLLEETRGDAEMLETWTKRRVQGEPLETIVGWAEFEGLRVVVAPGVFVPRRRTGFLVAEALRLVGSGSIVVDMCCGSGALGAAMLDRVAGLELYAADIDDDAVACARLNLPDAALVTGGDLFSHLPPSLRGRVDVVVCNAPYVPTEAIAGMPPEARDHEHRIALDGGSDGVDLHRRVANEARLWLRDGGTLLVETGEHQAPVTADAFRSAGLRPSIRSSDEYGATIVLGVRRPG